ncbi:MAG: M15 family metallopeptidase [Clostridia bacterium]|nr:M15 family metallopeptidase [Clostridia bacterium]
MDINFVDNEVLEKYEPIFSSETIPQNIYEKMIGNSIPEGSQDKVDISSLSYLKISYIGFDGLSHTGEMVCSSKVSNDILEIFKELYNIQYPIEKIKLIDEYGANDEASMSDNNTSCFCYRQITGSKSLSKHSLGLAIDINPLYNPYVKGKTISPKASYIYSNRNSDFEHKISKEDVLYNLFTSKGWTWGGDWILPKDYQHFEKNIDF